MRTSFCGQASPYRSRPQENKGKENSNPQASTWPQQWPKYCMGYMHTKKKYSLFIWNEIKFKWGPVFLVAKSGNPGVGVSVTSGAMLLEVGADLVLWFPNFVPCPEPGTCHVGSPVNDQHPTCFCLIRNINIREITRLLC